MAQHPGAPIGKDKGIYTEDQVAAARVAFEPANQLDIELYRHGVTLAKAQLLRHGSSGPCRM